MGANYHGYGHLRHEMKSLRYHRPLYAIAANTMNAVLQFLFLTDPLNALCPMKVRNFSAMHQSHSSVAWHSSSNGKLGWGLHQMCELRMIPDASRN